MKRTILAAAFALASFAAFAADAPTPDRHGVQADTKPGATVGQRDWCAAYPNDYFVKMGRSTCPSRAPNK